jgi:hypothetical protein
MVRLGKRRAGLPAGHDSDRIHCESCPASAWLNAFGGIGTGPQTPTLPLITFWLRDSTAFFCVLYFRATSWYDGPTSFLSTA